MDKKGKFIVIDGMDGSGKGTQLRLLQEKLTRTPVLFTREPGGTPHAEEIRELLLRQGGPASNAVCDFFLFWAARGSHVEDAVLPALEKGTHVISDRYDSSTFAFQIRGEQRKELEQVFFAVRNSLPQLYQPDVYIFLDLPPEVAYERRLKDAEQAKSKFDVKPLDYHARVRKGFQDFAQLISAECSSKKARLVDANRIPEEMHADIWQFVREELGV